MNLERRDGNVYLTPTEVPQPSVAPLSTNPSWEWMSEMNDSSWRDTMFDMALECADWCDELISTASTAYDAQKRAVSRSQAPLPAETAPPVPEPIRAPLPMPVDAWLATSGDEVVILMDDDTSILLPVRRIADTHTYHTLTVRGRTWAIWQAAKGQMERLGFSAIKEAGHWQLKFRPPMARNSVNL